MNPKDKSGRPNVWYRPQRVALKHHNAIRPGLCCGGKREFTVHDTRNRSHTPIVPVQNGKNVSPLWLFKATSTINVMN